MDCVVHNSYIETLPEELLGTVVSYLGPASHTRLCLSATWTSAYWTTVRKLDLSRPKSNISAYSEWPVSKDDLSRWITRISPGLTDANVLASKMTSGSSAATSYYDGYSRRETLSCDVSKILPLLFTSSPSKLRTLRVKLLDNDIELETKHPLERLESFSFSANAIMFFRGFSLGNLTNILRSTHLLSLDLTGVSLGNSDADVAVLSSLTQLTSLQFKSCLIHDQQAVARSIASLDRLKRFCFVSGVILSAIPIIDEDVIAAVLASLTQLESLTISTAPDLFNSVMENHLHKLSTQLRTLDLRVEQSDSYMTVDMFRSVSLLKDFTKLVELKTEDIPLLETNSYPPHIKRFKIRDGSELAHQWQLPLFDSVESLKIIALTVYIEDPKLPLSISLQRLSLHVIDGLFDETAYEIAKLSRLTYLKVEEAAFTNLAVCKFASLTRLVELHLPSIGKLTAAPVAPLTNLRVLNLEKNQTLSSVAGLRNHPSLTELNLSFCKRLESRRLQLLTSVRTLRVLDIRGIPDTSDDTLLELTSLQNLEHCFAVASPDLTLEGWHRFRTAIPSLQTRIMPESKHNVM